MRDKTLTHCRICGKRVKGHKPAPGIHPVCDSCFAKKMGEIGYPVPARPRRQYTWAIND